MTAISNSTASSATQMLETAQRPPMPTNDYDKVSVDDNVDMADCFPIDLDESMPLPGGLDEAGPDEMKPIEQLKPFEDREMFVTEDGQIGWRVVVSGTSDDDTIDVVYNRDGSADVTVNGETTHYSAEEAQNMRVDGGAGDDTITIEDNRVGTPFQGEGGSLTVDGGSGDDTITMVDNTIFGGGGSVTVNGGSGDDNISGDLKNVDVDGGTGDDTINGWPEFDFTKPLPPEFPPLRDPGFADPLPDLRQPGMERPEIIPL